MFLNISAALQTKDNACDFTDVEFIMSLLLNVEKIENYIVVQTLLFHFNNLVNFLQINWLCIYCIKFYNDSFSAIPIIIMLYWV